MERLQGEVGRLGEVIHTRDEEVALRDDLVRRLQREIVRLGTLVETSTRELTSFRERPAQEETGRAEAERLRGRITAMESSKFWKVRTLWFRLKRAVGLASQE